jgi:branched-subunit amino acid aminotransferase/4-amino-4-deoxychorismate lyase
VKSFICFNGNFIDAMTPVIMASNRAFRYGDGLFESMRAINTSIPFFNEHYERLTKGIAYLEMETDRQLSPDMLKKQITRLLNANKHFAGSRVRLEVFRSGSGFYKPEEHTTGFVIETHALPATMYELQTTGLKLDIYKEINKHSCPFHAFKTIPSLLQIKASIWAASQKADDAILVNEHNEITETTHANLFVVYKNSLYTPALSSGCLPGIMRHEIIQLANSSGIQVFETPLNENHLLEGEECFITDAVNGIQWVLGFRNKRFTRNTSRFLSVKLAEKAGELIS